MDKEKIVSELNSLITKNYDAEEGYKKVADKSDNPVLRSYYLNKSSNRYTYGHQIKDLIADLGGEVEKGTSAAGDLHRTWIDLKALFSFHIEEALLEEVERGEAASLHDYDEFLKLEDLPTNVRRVISYQRHNIARSLRQADKLEDQVD